MNLLVKLEFYFFKWISQVIKGVRWAMELEKESGRKRWKEGERIERREGGQQRENDGKNQRQKATVAFWGMPGTIYYNLPLSGAPTSVVSLKCCWASNRSIEEISQLTTAIPKQNWLPFLSRSCYFLFVGRLYGSLIECGFWDQILPWNAQ